MLLARALAAALALASAAAGGEVRAQATTPVRVAATIFPLADIAREVADGAVEVVSILPPGASPHTFEPTPDKVRRLSGARALFVVGHGLDDWAVRVARGVGVTRVVPVDSGIRLRRGEDGAVDPHYWLSIENGKAIARSVAAELERLLPARRPELRRALAAYLERLDAADAEIRRTLSDLPTRRIATFHDAFGYFADAYGLEVVAVFQPFPGKEPSPRFLREFHRKIRASGVPVVFFEPQLSVDAIRPIARDLGVTLSLLDPMGGLPGRDGYIPLMRFNAAQVKRALGRRPP